jgi:hypothetical protein
MPRYFMDVVQAGEVYDDYYGMELPNMAAVQKEVEATIREIVSDAVRAGLQIGDGEIWVRNTKGKRVLAVTFRDVVH